MKRIGILVVILLVLGLALVSYDQLAQELSVETPAPTKTPTPTEEEPEESTPSVPQSVYPGEEPTPNLEPPPTSIPEIEVEWETGGPDEAEWMYGVFIDDNEGKVVYCAGGLPGDLFGFTIWRTENGGKTWKFLGSIDNPEISFKNKEQFLQEYLETNLFTQKKDQNNENIVLSSQSLGWVNLGDYGGIDWKFLLSFDRGETCSTLNPPPGIEPVGNDILTDKYHFDLISHEGILKIFLAATGKVWQADIRLP